MSGDTKEKTKPGITTTTPPRLDAQFEGTPEAGPGKWQNVFYDKSGTRYTDASDIHNSLAEAQAMHARGVEYMNGGGTICWSNGTMMSIDTYSHALQLPAGE